jgi:hypothetical protein
MSFLGPDDILVLVKNKGTVDRIYGTMIKQQPLLHIDVATEVEHGMLGIAVAGVNKDGSVAPNDNVPQRMNQVATTKGYTKMEMQ